MNYASNDIEMAKRRAEEKAALALARHRNIRAEQSEKRFYVIATGICLIIAVVFLLLCVAKAEDNAELRQSIARTRADEVDARLALYAYLRDCRAQHEARQAEALGSWIAFKTRARGMRLINKQFPSSHNPPLHLLSPSLGTAESTGAAAIPPVAAPPFDFKLRDFIAGYICSFNRSVSVEDAETLADACLYLSAGNEDDALRWCATSLAENSGRLHGKPNRIGCYGAFQINEPVHRDKLAAMDLDIYSNFADQVTFAEHLYSRRKWQPWIASITNTKKYLRELRSEWKAINGHSD